MDDLLATTRHALIPVKQLRANKSWHIPIQRLWTTDRMEYGSRFAATTAAMIHEDLRSSLSSFEQGARIKSRIRVSPPTTRSYFQGFTARYKLLARGRNYDYRLIRKGTAAFAARIYWTTGGSSAR